MILVVFVGLVVVSCGGDAATDTTQPDATTAESLPATTTAAATSTTTDGPVAAADAQIEIGYTDEGVWYIGDRQIVEGSAAFSFRNESDDGAVPVLLWYESGSTALAEVLEVVEEGERVIVGRRPPPEPYVEIELDEQLQWDSAGGLVVPGSYTWTQVLEPGTYIFDVGPEDFHQTGFWRAAVIEVVADD